MLLDERVIVSVSILEGEESSFVFGFVNKVIVQSDAITINELEITNRYFVRIIYFYPFIRMYNFKENIIFIPFIINSKNLSFHSSFYSFIVECYVSYFTYCIIRKKHEKRLSHARDYCNLFRRCEAN